MSIVYLYFLGYRMKYDEHEKLYNTKLRKFSKKILKINRNRIACFLKNYFISYENDTLNKYEFVQTQLAKWGNITKNYNLENWTEFDRVIKDFKIWYFALTTTDNAKLYSVITELFANESLIDYHRYCNAKNDKYFKEFSKYHRIFFMKETNENEPDKLLKNYSQLKLVMSDVLKFKLINDSKKRDQIFIKEGKKNLEEKINKAIQDKCGNIFKFKKINETTNVFKTVKFDDKLMEFSISDIIRRPIDGTIKFTISENNQRFIVGLAIKCFIGLLIKENILQTKEIPKIELQKFEIFLETISQSFGVADTIIDFGRCIYNWGYSDFKSYLVDKNYHDLNIFMQELIVIDTNLLICDISELNIHFEEMTEAEIIQKYKENEEGLYIYNIDDFKCPFKKENLIAFHQTIQKKIMVTGNIKFSTLKPRIGWVIKE